MREVMRVVEFFDQRRIASFEVSEGLVGGAAYDAAGTPLTDATLAQAMAGRRGAVRLGRRPEMGDPAV